MAIAVIVIMRLPNMRVSLLNGRIVWMDYRKVRDHLKPIINFFVPKLTCSRRGNRLMPRATVRVRHVEALGNGDQVDAHPVEIDHRLSGVCDGAE
jgi:hypothetical protein